MEEPAAMTALRLVVLAVRLALSPALALALLAPIVAAMLAM